MANQPATCGISPRIISDIHVLELNPVSGVLVTKQMMPSTTVLETIEIVVNENVSSLLRPLRTVSK